MAIGDCNCGVGFECTGCTLCTVQSLVWVYVHYIVFSHFCLFTYVELQHGHVVRNPKKESHMAYVLYATQLKFVAGKFCNFSVASYSLDLSCCTRGCQPHFPHCCVSYFFISLWHLWQHGPCCESPKKESHMAHTLYMKYSKHLNYLTYLTYLKFMTGKFRHIFGGQLFFRCNTYLHVWFSICSGVIMVVHRLTKLEI